MINSKKILFRQYVGTRCIHPGHRNALDVFCRRPHHPHPNLGCAFRFYSGSGPASFFGILRFPRITSDSTEHTSELNHSRARLIFFRNPTESGILAGIPKGRTIDMVSCATCNKHSLRRNEKNRCQRWHTAVSYCCYCAPPQATTPCCRHCCHCLIRGSTSGGAGVAAWCGGSGSSSSGGSSGGGSGAILFLVVVIILLIFARPLSVGIILPLFVARCSFCRPLIAHRRYGACLGWGDTLLHL